MKEKKFKPQILQRMVTVTDDWYPCFEGNQIRLSIMMNHCKRNNKDVYWVRICAWGADDFGLELDYDAGPHFDMAQSIFQQWKEKVYDVIPDGVNQDWFYDHCFYRA